MKTILLLAGGNEPKAAFTPNPRYRAQHRIWCERSTKTKRTPLVGLVMVALCNRAEHYIIAVVSFFFLFSSPNLSGWRLDVYHTKATWCGLSANLECMSEMCCTRLTENTGRKKSPFWHHRTTLSGCIFAAEACIDNRKKLVKHPYLPHMSS